MSRLHGDLTLFAGPGPAVSSGESFKLVLRRRVGIIVAESSQSFVSCAFFRVVPEETGDSEGQVIFRSLTVYTTTQLDRYAR